MKGSDRVRVFKVPFKLLVTNHHFSWLSRLFLFELRLFFVHMGNADYGRTKKHGSFFFRNGGIPNLTVWVKNRTKLYFC